jgi:hypothetical protein
VGAAGAHQPGPRSCANPSGPPNATDNELNTRRAEVLLPARRDIRERLASRLVEDEDAAFVRLRVEAFIRLPDRHQPRPEAIDLLAPRLPGGPAFGPSTDTDRHCRVGPDIERPGVWALRGRPNVADHESVPVSHVEQGSRSKSSRSTARGCQQQYRPPPHQGYAASGQHQQPSLQWRDDVSDRPCTNARRAEPIKQRHCART